MPPHERPPLDWRYLAVLCFHETQGKMSKAARLFKERTGHQCMQRPEGFIARWIKATKELRPLARDAHRSGRTCKLSEEEAVKAADILLAGFQQKGSNQRLQYTSIKQALAKDAALKEIQQSKGVCARTMMRSMKRVRPALCQRTERFSQPLSEAQKTARFLASKKLIKQPRHYFQRTIWIDAAKFYVDLGKARKVWVDGSQPQRNLEPRDSRAKGKRAVLICLAYYAAVNAELGPVYIKLTSGTKGYKGCQLKDFKVVIYLYNGQGPIYESDKSVQGMALPNSCFFARPSECYWHKQGCLCSASAERCSLISQLLH